MGRPPRVVAVSRGDLVVLGGILALAAALRLPGIRYGLPLPVLNPDERSIVPRAWEMVHGGGLDPGWYDYPSLLIALVAPTQALADEPSYGAARALAVAIGLAGVAASWWLGRVAYGRWAGIVGAAGMAVATTHVAYSRVAVTDALLALGVTVALALLVTDRIGWAGLAIGLAASAKYPGAILLVPLVVAAWGRRAALLRALALAAGGFAATSPFVLVHAGAAWQDVRRVQELARAGWLGFEDDPVTPLAFLDRVWDTLGPFAILGGLLLGLALARRTRPDLILASFAISYWVWLMPLQAHFDRYVLPLVPILAIAAGSVRVVAPLAVVLLALPLAWSIADTAPLLQTDTRVRAEAWVTANIPASERIALDPSTLTLPGRDVVRLDLPGPGRSEDERRRLDRLRAEGVSWVVATGAVADRVMRHAELYPTTASFYRALDRDAERVFRATPDDPGLSGPWVRIYRLP